VLSADKDNRRTEPPPTTDKRKLQHAFARLVYNVGGGNKNRLGGKSMKNLLADLQATLHHEIPVTQHMGLQVAWCEPDYVTLKAPLKANINHKNTVFGGSLNSIATLAGWSLLWVILRDAKIEAEIVIQDSSTEYLLPVNADFSATCRRPDPTTFNRFLTMLQRKGIGRIELCSEIYNDDKLAVRFKGRFVATRQ
jgi:thioesterase domain-containing protein